MKFQNALTDIKIKNAKPKAKDYKLADGEGLHILVKPSGAKYWRYNYRFDGSFKTLAIGVYPAVTLKAARERHEEAALLVKQGVDPVEVRKAQEAAEAADPIFREVAEQWRLMIHAGKRAPKTVARDLRNIAYLNAAFGDVKFSELRVRHLSTLLNRFEEAGKFDSRVKVQAAAKSIGGFAVGRGLVERNPFSDVNFSASYTSPVATREPRPALVEPKAFGHLLRQIDLFADRNRGFGTISLTGIGLKLLALTFVRPGELRAAEWRHVDLDKAKWVVPPEQLKMRSIRKSSGSNRAERPHEVPLSRQAVELLRLLHKHTGQGRFVLPGRQSNRYTSHNTLNDALKAMGYRDIHCAHGFRSSASTLLNAARIDVNGRKVRRYEKALIEMQLDHVDQEVQAIYDRGDCWDDRVELMQFWADMIDTMRKDDDAPKARPPLRIVAA